MKGSRKGRTNMGKFPLTFLLARLWCCMRVSSFMRQFDPLFSKSSTASTWERKGGGEWGLKRDPFNPLVSQVMTHFLLVSSYPCRILPLTHTFDCKFTWSECSGWGAE